MRPALSFRHVEIVDQYDTVILKRKDIPVKKGLVEILNAVRHKDSAKSFKSILYRFATYVDDDFKKLLGMEDKEDEDQFKK